ncbi:MAG TPA: PAS domain S-box protein [Gaiellaceae bacterium]|nr:PAS domain S-box protein [Gaiellaceae bacterium]
MTEIDVAAGTGTDDLLFQKSLLEAQTEASVDGILVVSPEGRILSFNRRFVELWEIPDDVIASRSDEAAVAAVRSRLLDPDAFVARVAYLYEHPDEESRDVLELVDGRVIERHSAPVRDADGTRYGRVWFFRDVTERVRSGEELRARVEELDTLYRMAAAVVGADSLESVLEEALDTLTAAFGTDRASVLLADDDGVMRFRAWRGLSDEYRAAAEGHSPWPADAEDPQPVLVPDVEEDEELAPFRHVILGEGIRALAFIPLVHRRRLLGKFMVYRPDRHDFDERELRVAQAIASHIAEVAERARAEARLRESRDQLEVILRAAADGITVQDPQGRLVYANDAAARLIGFGSAGELLSTPLPEVMSRFELLDADRRPLDLERLPGRRALARGEEAAELVCYRVRETGEERWSYVRATPVVGPDGEVQFAVNAFQDVTAAHRAEERSSFLARAGVILSSSLDYEATLRTVASLAVPQVADWCIAYIQEDDRSIRRIALEHAGNLADRVAAILERHPLIPDADDGVPLVIRTGEPALVPDMNLLSLSSDVADPRRLAEELSFLDMCSYMCVPLTARGRTFGAISLLSGESGRRFGPSDLDLAEELARRAGLAIDNARLYGEAQAAARAMQESYALLDSVLASAPVGIGFWDTDLRYVRVNDALAQINGLPAEEHPGRTLAEVVPALAPQLEPIYRQVLESGEPFIHHEATGEVPSAPGDERHWLTSYYPVRTADGEIHGLGAVILEVTDRRRAEQERARRVRQQAVVAELGQAALEGRALTELMQDAVERLAETLGVEYAKVLELLPGGRELRLRAGVGWRDGLVGAATVSAGTESQAGFTLMAQEPVVVEDLAAETRFAGPPLLHEHGVVSGMSVVVGDRADAYGVLGVHTARRRSFTDDDVTYLQAVANVLATAVARERGEAQRANLLAAEQAARAAAEAARERLAFLADASRVLSASLDYETTLENVAQLAGRTYADWAVVYLVDEATGGIRQIRGSHRDPAKDAAVRDVIERYPPSPVPGTPLHAALEEGRSTVLPAIDEELLRRATADEEHFRLVRDLGFTSAMVAPIQIAGSVIGAIAFARAGGEAYGELDLETAEELARRAGLAIENARLYQAAKYQSELTRTIADNAASALFMMDARGRPTYMNPAAEAMTGYSLDEIRHAPLHEAIHHTHPDGTPYPIEDCPIDSALPRQRTLRPYEDVFVRKDGTFFPVLTSASPIISDGDPVGTVIEVRDITEEKRAERERAELLAREQEARREAEARAQASNALQFVGDGVFLLDRAGVVRLWNPAAEAITGLRAPAVEGRLADHAIPGWAELASRVPIVSADAATPARPETLPIEIGGREIWLSISGVGFDEGTVFAFRDVTEERGVEKLKSDFVSTVSHELRTPLAAIYGAALTLRRPDFGREASQQEPLLDVIASESQRLARIVNDILWTSRIESGGLQVTIEECDGAALAAGVVQSALLHVPPNVTLELAVPDEPVRVAADPDKVRQVLANMLENAIKYSPDGGRVELRVERHGSSVRFSVSDEGLGIPPVEQARIFEKFYRLDPGLTRGVGGTGLGLYICRQLVERMGGRIWVESDGRSGSTFAVDLPGA